MIVANLPKNIKKYIAMLLAILVAMMALVGCAETTESSSDDTELLETYTQIPQDGIITQEQIASIAGQEGTWYFTGSIEDGIEYSWAYDGSMIQNPVEQNLKLALTEDGTDEIKKAAEDAPYCLAVTIADMYLAAAPTLTIVLPTVWEAQRVVYCIYEDEQLYELSDAAIEVDEEAKTTTITLTINKAGGTFYVLGGGSIAEAKENESDRDTDASSNQDDASDNDKDSGTKQSSSSASSDETDKSQSNTASEDEENTCTITIRCDTILDNMDKLDSSKKEFVPSSGVILKKTTVTYDEGDTVFDILKAVCQKKGIHMSSQYTPGYGSYYVEGINQLYEFDCGENSGWIYSVNGWTPNYGASEYTVENGDVISWEYTCNLGSDL
ncbi:DUF4430 domain-containing protein [Eubacterium oxidoreducens]|uniref:Transcobalamin-like C-terminal domain-containing protein n=1 Tax=Eubacterium oxidoreducens TaxID=1732 RepID=A0A1G6A9Z7_EUBOX|nr:DUF4430 domain-containing protein [Eubacterium oxidoreducens]SDB05255.1 protein of unknown function [Eubacterium oxidoreducens]